MPAAHSLNSLLAYLKSNVVGKSHTEHNVLQVKRELGKWYPRPNEYEKYVMWNENDPSKYTRNLVFKNENMEVLLMCWPGNSQSTIHDHDQSSCWVRSDESSFLLRSPVMKLVLILEFAWLGNDGRGSCA